MNRIITVYSFILILSFLFHCGGKEVVLEKQPWIDLPRDEWPVIAMTNHIQFQGHEYLDQANGFLIEIAGDTLAVTSKHWFLVFQWHVRLTSVSFRDKLINWEMYPKDKRDEKVVLGELINENREEKVVKDEIFKTDWLLLSVVQKSDSIYPLKPRFSKLKKDEKIYIIGWKDSENYQPPQIYEGRNIEADGGKYVVDMGGNFPGLSGAPVIDEKGYLVGISSASFKKYSWVNSTEYLMEVLKDKGIISEAE